MEAKFKICSGNQFRLDGKGQAWALQVVTSQIRNPCLLSFKKPDSRQREGALEKDMPGNRNKGYVWRKGQRRNYCSIKAPYLTKRKKKEEERKLFYHWRKKQKPFWIYSCLLFQFSFLVDNWEQSQHKEFIPFFSPDINGRCRSGKAMGLPELFSVSLLFLEILLLPAFSGDRSISGA